MKGEIMGRAIAKINSCAPPLQARNCFGIYYNYSLLITYAKPLILIHTSSLTQIKTIWCISTWLTLATPPCLVIIPTIHQTELLHKNEQNIPTLAFYSLAHSSVSIRSLITYGCRMLSEHCGTSYRSIVLSTFVFKSNSLWHFLILFLPDFRLGLYIIRICEIWRPTVSGTRVWPS